MATEKELQQENEKLTARLQKAVQVFNEQKATIARQAEEIAALKAKAAEAEKKDSEFFDQVNEIESLKASLLQATAEMTDLKKELEKKEKECKQATDDLTKAKSDYETVKKGYDQLSKRYGEVLELVNKDFE